jgi:Uncharacterized protein conserved in bacteria
MVRENQTRKTRWQFLPGRPKAAIRVISAGALVLSILVLIRTVGFVRAGSHAETQPPTQRATNDPDWSELIAAMDKMHAAMGTVERSSNSDLDFVRLMLPHHQAAIDMAKTQLLYGKDVQMRRLAQEIITDQQLEIELMQRWLKQQEVNQTAPADSRKDN